MHINDTVQRLKTKYRTSDPYELADALGIIVLRENLGTIKGYYNKPYRMKQIHINQDLSRHEQQYTCAHELGHAVLHPDSNTSFLQEHTFFSIDKLEKEANAFAVDLLIDDSVLLEFCQCTTLQLARLLRYDEDLIKLRLEEWQKI